MDLGIAGRVALVTASSKGLGRGAALALASEGVHVVLNARDAAQLRATEAELCAAGGDVVSVVGDVTDPDMPARLVEAAVDRFGGLDILVANAGGPPPARALEIDDEQIAAAVNANLTTSIRLVRAAVPHMRANKWGRICLVTSVTIKQPNAILSLSNLARTGLWAWAKTAAADLFPEGITLNLACPGTHETDRIRDLGYSGPMGDPEDFGHVVAFLCSRWTGFVSGTAVGVDGASVQGLL